MSSESSTAGTPGSNGSRVLSLLRRTGVAIRGALGRRDGKAISLGATLGYFALLEYVSTNLGAGTGDFDVLVVSRPFEMMTRQTAPFQFEPIALLSLGPIEYLFSPLTAAISLGVASLVGVNLAVSYVVWRGPTACRVNPGVGALAGVPGLLSGFVCCGPTILLVIGVQASAALVAAFQWALPAAVVLLLASLLWVGRHVEIVEQ
jgi:hypothetical protein